MLAVQRISLLARIVKVSALWSTAVRTMATGGAVTDAGRKGKVALITGITGQVGMCKFQAICMRLCPGANLVFPSYAFLLQDGSYLAELLLEKGYHVSNLPFECHVSTLCLGRKKLAYFS